MHRITISLFIFFIFNIQVYSQTSKVRISGKITNENKEVIEAATVYVEKDKSTYISTQKGEYELSLEPGEYFLVCIAMGYERFREKINIRSHTPVKKNITLRSTVKNLEEVIVMGKSLVKEVKESAYNVSALDAKPLYNTTMDISSALDKMSGVKIRNQGGFGSDQQISLNGYTGRHVKVFMDGMPMDGSGSSFRINNIPLNLADRIEVYKGVVPIEFGTDAIGGAINIVTRNTAQTYVDASYSYGSFNTHKSNVILGYTGKNGFTTQINAYQNYSDNDYKVYTYYLILEGDGAGTYSNEKKWFRRFHDKYHNEGIAGKVGFVNKPWADRLLLGFRYTQEDKQIQNSNVIRIVFGGKKSKAKAITPSFTYLKRNLFTDNLDFSLNAHYNKTRNNNIDTLARKYSWDGNFTNKQSKGEGEATLGKYDNKNGTVTTNLSYRLFDKHFISINNVFTSYERKSVDALSTTGSATADYYMKRTNKKNVFGASYKFVPIAQWNAMIFYKYYKTKVRGPIDTSGNGTYELQNRRSNAGGYGIATTYSPIAKIQLKASYERALRLPTDKELFGDEVNEKGDSSLKPEKSNNVNFNISYEDVFNKYHSIYIEAGLVYRYTTDYIRRMVREGSAYGTAYSTNHGKVRTWGFDVEAKYFYKKIFSIGGNYTVQNARNLESKNATGQPLVYYKDRMPNVPYSFGAADAGYHLHHIFQTRDNLSVSYTLNYTHAFYRSWKSSGGDLIIPEQLYHDLAITYSMQDGRYNISIEAKNITNELLYDNFSLQKPGRNFGIKFRYFFHK